MARSGIPLPFASGGSWPSPRVGGRLLDPSRAELELWDLAERVEGGVGEEVGGGLGEAERDEDEAGGDVAVGAGGELDRASAGGHADGGAGVDAETPQVAG